MGAKYYESELAYLREMGREFAEVHPSTAGLLAEKGNDPDVERLLEGFAFLTARIRERVDDGVPAIVHGLAQLLLPHYLRPIPATSIIQYLPPLRSLRGVQTVPRGTRVAAKPLHGTSCEFRTTQDVDLLPLEVEDAVLDETSAARPVLRLRMVTTEAGRAVLARPEGIRLFLHGEIGLTASLFLWLARYCTSVSLRSGHGAPTVLGDGSVVAPVGFAPEQGLLPWPKFAHEGYRYLQEYFTLPAKFMFVDVLHFDRVALTDDMLELAFTFERPPALPGRISAENFRLFCTPVVNLFESSADPIKRDPRIHEHLLRVAGMSPRHMEVYEVTSVIGVRQGQVRRKEYSSFVSYGHGADPRDPGYYVLRPTTSPIDDGMDTYLSIVTPQNAPVYETEEVLSIDVVATNRSLPADLQLGEICTTPRGVSSPAPLKNIAPVSAPVRPPLGDELHWRLLSHIALGRGSLAQTDTLAATLALYNFQQGRITTTGRANERKIESIRRVESDPVTRVFEGAPVRGARVSIELDESRLGTVGEAFLFGCILDELFATHVPLNSLSELVIVLHPSKTEFRWPARNGQRSIL